MDIWTGIGVLLAIVALVAPVTPSFQNPWIVSGLWLTEVIYAAFLVSANVPRLAEAVNNYPWLTTLILGSYAFLATAGLTHTYLVPFAGRHVSAASDAHAPPRAGEESKRTEQTGKMLPAKSAYIRTAIETLAHEIRLVSGQQFRNECPVVPPQQLGAERPPMQMFALTPEGKFTVVESLRPLASAFANVYAGFLFEPNPPEVGGRRVTEGYEGVFSAYQNVLSKPWVVSAIRHADGAPLSGDETFNICLYGLRKVDDAILDRLLTSLAEAEHNLREGSLSPLLPNAPVADWSHVSPLDVTVRMHRPDLAGPYFSLEVRNNSDEPLRRLSVQWSRFDPQPKHLGHPPLTLLRINESLDSNDPATLEADLAPGQFVTFVVAQLNRFQNHVTKQPDHTFWLFSAGRNRRMPIGGGPFVCEILITAHNMKPITSRWRLALDSDIVFQRLDCRDRPVVDPRPAEQVSGAALPPPETGEEPFDVDVANDGYYVMASADASSSQPVMPGIWAIAKGVVITNRTNRKIPLELSLEIGMRRDGSWSISSSCADTWPAWILTDDLKDSTPFGRLVNLPPLEAQHGFLAARFSSSIQAEAGATDLEDLTQGRPYWISVENKLTGVRTLFPLNFIARNVD